MWRTRASAGDIARIHTAGRWTEKIAVGAAPFCAGAQISSSRVRWLAE
jgi:hypothetical protein